MDLERQDKETNTTEESNKGGDTVGCMGSSCCSVDSDHMFGLVGIAATVLNLLIVVFVYLYTPV